MKSLLDKPSRLINLEVKGKNDGYLVPLEAESGVVPFAVKRVYYIYGVGVGLRRGFHAHKNLKQLIICVSGRCTVDVDDSYHRESYTLDSPLKGLIIEEPLWREMYDFTTDCVLLVLASEHYDPSDYIQNYRDFITFQRHAHVEPE